MSDNESQLVAIQMVCDVSEAYPRINPIYGPKGLEGFRPGRVRKGETFTYVGEAEESPRDWAHAVDEKDAETLAAAHRRKAINKARGRREKAVRHARDLAGIPQPELLDDEAAAAEVPVSPIAKGPPELEALRAEAAELGIPYSWNMKAETLTTKIAEFRSLAESSQAVMEAAEGDPDKLAKPAAPKAAKVTATAARPSDTVAVGT